MNGPDEARPANPWGAIDIERACVYTCLFGGYEELVEQPAASASTLPFVCVTDDPELSSETWAIRVVEPVLPLDPARASRHPKLFPEQYLAETDASVYIDNSVRLKGPPDGLLNAGLADPEAGLALARHSFHTSLRQEADAIVRLGFEDPDRVDELVHVVERLAPELIEERPYWGGLLIRRHGDAAVGAAMSDWWNHVLRYSRRDQLSLPLVLARHPDVGVNELALDNHDSAYHEWPVAPRPGRESYAAEARGSARYRELEQEIAATQARNHQLASTVDQLTRSLSWRVTAPIRALAAKARRR